MPFFVKLTTQAKSWGWCYAEAVRRTSGVITLSGVHAPIFGAKSLSIFQGDYPWAIENGWLHAYPVRTELPWSQTRAGAVVYPSFIPERIVREGLDAAVEFALRAPVLRAVFSDEAVRRCAAEDQILDHEIAKLRSPCFLPPNDQEIVRWAGLRPSAFAHASADADRIVSEQHLGGVRATARRRLRMEAHRKIDCTQEHFTSTPCLASDPYLELTTDFGPVRVGRLKKASYPEGVTSRPINPRAQDENTLAAYENAILPGDGDMAERMDMVPWQEAFATWEEASPLQAISAPCWTEAAPEGLKPRHNLRWPLHELSSVGVFPIISELANQYLQGRISDLPDTFSCAKYCLQRIWRAD